MRRSAGSIIRGLPFQGVFQPDIVEVFLAESVPAAAFLRTDMEIDQPLACTYDKLCNLTPAIATLSSLNKQRFMAMKTIQIADHFILGNADGGLGGKDI